MKCVDINGRIEHSCSLRVPLKGLASLCSHCSHRTKAGAPVPVPGEGDCSVNGRLRRPHRKRS